jgi:hypothetical protein
MLIVFINNKHMAAHGARKTDPNRKGYRAMDYPSVVRMTSKRFRDVLDIYTLDGHPEYTGLSSYLKMTYTYDNMFSSRSCSLENRIESAAYVISYLLIWRGWAKNYVETFNSMQSETERKLKLDDVYVTREAMTDVILSCHFIVLIIVAFREEWPGLAIPFWRLGSDCCEDLFSSLGSFVMNKRTYSIMDALTTLRAKMRSGIAAFRAGIQTAKRVGGKTPQWVEDESLKGDQTTYPSERRVPQLLRAGTARAKREMERLGLRLLRQGREYEWYKNPWGEFPIPKGDPDTWLAEAFGERSEEELLGSSDSDEDDEEGGGSGSGDDGDSGDDENKDSDDEEKDAEDVMELLVDLVDDARGEQHQAEINPKMAVPGHGDVYKMTICAWMASGTENVSNDRGTRAAQANHGGVLGMSNRPGFDIAESEWNIELGHDVAVMFDDAFIGRVIRIRRKCAKSWVEYVYPVDIQQAKADGLDLFFTICWYAVTGTEGEYTYGVHEPKEVALDSIICPVALTLDSDRAVYTLPADQRHILDLNLEGAEVVELVDGRYVQG